MLGACPGGLAAGAERGRSCPPASLPSQFPCIQCVPWSAIPSNLSHSSAHIPLPNPNRKAERSMPSLTTFCDFQQIQGGPQICIFSSSAIICATCGSKASVLPCIQCVPWSASPAFIFRGSPLHPQATAQKESCGSQAGGRLDYHSLMRWRVHREIRVTVSPDLPSPLSQIGLLRGQFGRRHEVRLEDWQHLG